MQLTPEKIIWVKAPFSKERGAFYRLSLQFGIPMKTLEEAYDDANPRPMTEMIWRRLDNSVSWKVRSPADVKTDVSEMIDKFNTGKVTAPIILVRARDVFHLVAGEQQLLVARASGIFPKAVFVRTN